RRHRVEDRRLEEPAGAALRVRRPSAAGGDGDAARTRALDIAGHLVEMRGGGERADLRTAQTMAEPEAGRTFGETLDQFGMHPALDDEARTGGADLPGILVDRTEHAFHGGIHVRIGHDDDRRLAAEFE